MRVPGQYIEIDNSGAGAATELRRILLLGQKASTPQCAREPRDPHALFLFAQPKPKRCLGQGACAMMMYASAKHIHPTGEVWPLPFPHPVGAWRHAKPSPLRRNQVPRAGLRCYVATATGKRPEWGQAMGAQPSPQPSIAACNAPLPSLADDGRG